MLPAAVMLLVLSFCSQIPVVRVDGQQPALGTGLTVALPSLLTLIKRFGSDSLTRRRRMPLRITSTNYERVLMSPPRHRLGTKVPAALRLLGSLSIVQPRGGTGVRTISLLKFWTQFNTSR